MNKNILYPNAYFKNVLEITIDFLNENKIKGLILDVDNTLIDYNRNMLNGLEKWAEHMKQNNIKLYILSNSNKKDKVSYIANKLNIEYSYFAKKPFKSGFNRVKEILKLSSENIAVVGDQIFTDVIGANRCKMFAILVKPIDEKDIWVTKIKRPIEDKIINILKNLPNESNYLDYKQIPYFKEKKPAFIKDIIAFLNSKEALEKDKFIIIGVTDKLELIGLPKDKQMLDDASYQTWITTYITPQPIIETGSISYKEKTFGYIYIPSTKNNQYIYEVKLSCINNNKENNIVLQGQSFGRTGSQNKVLFQKDRIALLSAIEKNNQRFTNLEPIYLSQDSDSSIPVFIVACMLGSWNERYPKDIELIETLSNRTYSDFKNLILSLQKQYPAQIQYQLSEWTFANLISLAISKIILSLFSNSIIFLLLSLKL